MNNEILHLEAEEVSLQSEINETLVKANVTDAVIASLKEKYLPLKLESLNDREGYERIVEARKDCKQLRVMAEKICKAGREPANKIADAWIAKQNEVCNAIKSVEGYLLNQEKEYDAEREKERKEKIERENKQWLSRSLTLTQLGAKMIGDCLVLEDISFEASLIKECDDDSFETIVKPPYEEIFQRNEQIRIDKEALERIQREEFLQQQIELQQEKQRVNQAAKQQAEQVAALQQQVQLNSAGDKEKWQAIVQHLSKTPIHVMVSSQYKTKMKAVREFLNDLNIEVK